MSTASNGSLPDGTQIPSGHKLCDRCHGNKTMTFGSKCMICNGKGFTRG
jgi:DnaJ-class molecular chaperone